MMPVPNGNTMSTSVSRERCQRLVNLNVEIQKCVKGRNISDSNAWRQMRDNYQSIILDDHEFSGQHDVEYALWQLHHRRIADFRSRLNTAMRSLGLGTSQAGNASARVELVEQVQKIRSQFRNFISEATGFYHELISAIRTKYRLPPPSYFSEDLESRNVFQKNGEESSDVNRGIMSCHRCLIYLGDLARYKVLYGEGKSKGRDYLSASNYYKEAASLCPSSGNPHHQLAILASYSGDDLLAVYWYFRSLAADNPFSTARDNLIIAFEKNRESYLEQSRVINVSKGTPVRKPGKGRGRVVVTSAKEKSLGITEIYKTFCIRFVRLNGILFTRTSLETFGEVFALVIRDLNELLSSGKEEKMNFGEDTAENRHAIVIIISILIYTFNLVNRDSKGQSYAEILQRPVLLQNAFVAAFEIAGRIIKRCIQFQDITSSFFLPGILVFLEWLACCPDIAVNSEAEENQATAWSFFWNECIAFLNKLIMSSCDSNGDETATYLANMRGYNEVENGNQFALWEDFELRGFVPLLSAQKNLDFSRSPVCNDGGAKTRVQRILAAGKSLAGVVRIKQQGVYYNQKEKRFIIGDNPNLFGGSFMLTSSSETLKPDGMAQFNHVEINPDFGILQPVSLSMDGGQEEDEDEEEEEIVFKPTIVGKLDDGVGPKLTTYGVLCPRETAIKNEVESYSPDPLGSRKILDAAYKQLPVSCGNVAPLQLQPFHSIVQSEHFAEPFDNMAPQHLQQLNSTVSSVQLPAFFDSMAPQQLEPLDSSDSNWLLEHQDVLFNGMRNLNVAGNGHVELAEGVLGSSDLPSFPHLDNFAAVSDESKELGLPMPTPWFPLLGAPGANGDIMTVKPANLKKSPVGRPVRHSGPPPGFSPVPHKSVDARSNWRSGNLPHDSNWIDHPQFSSSTNGSFTSSSINYGEQAYPSYVLNYNDTLTSSTMSFPFPGKQYQAMHVPSENQNIWQDFQLLDHLKLHPEPRNQQLAPGPWSQQANQQSPFPPDQYQGHTLWSGRSFV